MDKLPVDVLLCIVDFLPLNSAASFIFSRKKLVSTIGHRTRLALQAEESRRERLHFLYTMQRDWKGWVICFQCEKLHPVKRELLIYPQRHPLDEGPCSETDGIVELLPHHRLRWQHAHMIMRLNEQNSTDYSWLFALSHTIFERDIPYAHCCGRIANGNLLVKVEYRIFLRQLKDLFRVRSAFSGVCAH